MSTTGHHVRRRHPSSSGVAGKAVTRTTHGEVGFSPAVEGQSWSAARDGQQAMAGDLSADVIATQHVSPQTIVPKVNNNPLDRETASVVIDEDGITIEDGALTLRDAFGDTVLSPTGFSGSFDDFILSGGVYNNAFRRGPGGGAEIADDLAYWTVDKLGATVHAYHLDDAAVGSGHRVNLEIASGGAGGDYVELSQVVSLPDTYPQMLGSERYMRPRFAYRIDAQTGVIGSCYTDLVGQGYDVDGNAVGSEILLSQAVDPILVGVLQQLGPSGVLDDRAAFFRIALRLRKNSAGTGTASVSVYGLELERSVSAVTFHRTDPTFTPPQIYSEETLGESLITVVPGGVTPAGGKLYVIGKSRFQYDSAFNSDVAVDGELSVAGASDLAPIVRVMRRATNQSIPNSTWTLVDGYDSTLVGGSQILPFEPFGAIKSYQVLRDGLYLIQVNASFAPAAAGTRRLVGLAFATNATPVGPADSYYMNQSASHASSNLLNGSWLVPMLATQTVAFLVFQDSGAALNVGTVQLSVVRVGSGAVT